MRLLIVAPDQSEATGNLVTARRLQAGLAGCGIDAELALLPENAPETTYRNACRQWRPDAVLLLHAWRSGRIWMACREQLPLPAVVLLTGTDIHGGIDDPLQGPTIKAVLDSADLILSQNRLTVAALAAGPWGAKLRQLPPAVVLGDAPYPLRNRHGIPDDTVLFLHPAGIRPVKANLDLLRLCDPLAVRYPDFRLAFCGPVLDPDYALDFFAALTNRTWASWLGIIPPEAMPAALRAADVILNHSLSEGLSGVLLEALAVGRPILARDIPGNAAIIEDGANGLLYDSPASFHRQATHLAKDPELRQRLAASPRTIIDTGTEAKRLAELLQTLT